MLRRFFTRLFLGARMRLIVHFEQLIHCEMGILLRRVERRVAQQFLNHSQIRAFIEQVRGERVPQRVRANSARRQPAGIGCDEPLHTASREASAS